MCLFPSFTIYAKIAHVQLSAVKRRAVNFLTNEILGWSLDLWTFKDIVISQSER